MRIITPEPREEIILNMQRHDRDQLDKHIRITTCGSGLSENRSQEEEESDIDFDNSDTVSEFFLAEESSLKRMQNEDPLHSTNQLDKFNVPLEQQHIDNLSTQSCSESPCHSIHSGIMNRLDNSDDVNDISNRGPDNEIEPRTDADTNRTRSQSIPYIPTALFIDDQYLNDRNCNPPSSLLRKRTSCNTTPRTYYNHDLDAPDCKTSSKYTTQDHNYGLGLSVSVEEEPLPITPQHQTNTNIFTTNDNEEIRRPFTCSSLKTPTSPVRRRIKMSVSIPRNFPTQSPSYRIIKQKSHLIKQKSQQACAALRCHNQRLREQLRNSFRHQRARFAGRRNKKYVHSSEEHIDHKHVQSQPPMRKSRIIVIPSNHPYKIAWDFFIVLLTFISAYITHTSIRDRSYEHTFFTILTQLCFFLDVLLNFITDHRKADGTVMRSGREVWARYLTTWFVVDLLSVISWETMFVKPIIEKQNRRNIVVKWFLRSKATVKVSRFLKGRHFKIFGQVANSTKKIGIGSKRLLALIIKYVPKYLLFYRNMKAVLVLKVLRQIHFAGKIVRGFNSKCDEDGDVSTSSSTVVDDEDSEDEYDDWGSVNSDERANYFADKLCMCDACMERKRCIREEENMNNFEEEDDEDDVNNSLHRVVLNDLRAVRCTSDIVNQRTMSESTFEL